MKEPIRALCLLLWLLPGLASAQFTQTVRGQVVDEVTRAPIEGVTVKLAMGEAVKGTYSDSTGRFRFEQMPAGRYLLTATLLGYEPAQIPNIIVNTGKEVVLTVPMQESAVKVDDVVITGDDKRDARNEMSTVSSRQFTVDETQRYAGSWNDPSRMASNFAGVVNENDSRNDIIIRGNSPSGLLWRLEGVDIPNPNHFGAFGTTGGPVSILNNNLLDNSDFMTGAWPADYGNALGGVFDLRLRKGNDEQREFMAQIGVNGIEFLAEGPISRKNRSSYLASYRYSTLELFHVLGIRFGTSAQPKYQDFTFKLNFPTRKAGDFSLFGIGGLSYAAVLDSERDTADFFGPAGNDIWFGTNMGAMGLNHFLPIGEKTWIRSTLSFSAGDLTTTVNRIERVTKESIDFYRNSSVQSRATGAVHVNHKFSARLSGRAGFFLSRMYFNLQDSVQLDTNLGWRQLTHFKGATGLMQVYAEGKARLNAALTFHAGFYYQLFLLNGTGSPEPRLGLRWQFARRQSLSLGLGQHSQLQPIYVYFAEDLMPDSSFVQPNRGLGMTLSRHAVLGYDFLLTPHLRLKAEAYYQYIYNVPVNTGDSGVYSMLNEGADYYFVIPDSLANEGTGRNAGVELTVEKFFSQNYYFLFTGSLYDSKYTGGDGIERNTRFNGRFTLHLLVGAQHTIGKRKRWLAGIDSRISWAGGKFYTPLDAQASQLLLRPVYQDNLAYSVQTPNYFRVDGRVKIRLNSKKISQEWAVDITNILGRKNVLNQVYDYPSNSIRFNYQLGFFPVAQYKLEF